MRWRHQRRLPRWVVLVDGDQEWVVDFDNVLSVETFTALVRDRSPFVLTELFPGPGELCVEGPEGQFVHEIVLPYFKKASHTERAPDPGQARRPPPRRRASSPAVGKTFVPGSEWLYIKLYTGISTADRVLRHLAGPLTRQAMDSEAADAWFFARFDDPHWHLRLRLHGDARRLRDEVLPVVERTVKPFMASGEIWRWELATYRPEVERYGGTAGIELAERIAHVDSQAVLTILENTAGIADSDVRWRLALMGMDLLLAEFVASLPERLELVKGFRARRQRDLGLEDRPKQQLADRWRRERRELAALAEARKDGRHPLAPALAALEQRSRKLRPLAAELRLRAEADRLDRPPRDLVADYAHMFCNRLLEADAWRQELVLYDFLAQHLRSCLARGGCEDGLAAWR